MKPNYKEQRAFSLVEVVVAIGIFAFVIVGIIGLLPTALKIRGESALDTRAAMIAQQMMAAIDSSTTLSNVFLPVGDPKSGNPTHRAVNLLDSNSEFVVGFQARSTFPFWYYNQNPGSTWTNAGGNDAEFTESAANEITTLARITATPVTNLITKDTNTLARVTVEVRSPASLPLRKTTRVATFVTYRPQ